MGQMYSFFSKLIQQEFDDPIESDPVRPRYSLADYQPLLELQDKRQLVQVQVLNNAHSHNYPHSHHYQSMIVKLDFINGRIYLDALTPLNPYNPVAVGDTLVINHHDHGQILVVKGLLEDIVTEDREIMYVMTLPDDFGYKQRRFYPRLNIDNNGMIKLRLWSPMRIPWYTRVDNVSAGGARLSVGGNLCAKLKNNMALPNCDIELSSGQHICCKAIVKSFRYQRRPYERTEISVEFSNMGYQQKNWLLQWVDFNSRRYPVGLSN